MQNFSFETFLLPKLWHFIVKAQMSIFHIQQPLWISIVKLDLILYMTGVRNRLEIWGICTGKIYLLKFAIKINTFCF